MSLTGIGRIGLSDRELELLIVRMRRESRAAKARGLAVLVLAGAALVVWFLV